MQAMYRYRGSLLFNIRMWLHTVFLEWALAVMPHGAEKLSFASSVMNYLEPQIREAHVPR